MQIYEISGKEEKNLLADLLKNNQLEEKDIIYKISTKKTGLFKTTLYTITAAKLEDILDYLKKFLSELLSKMGMTVNYETKIRNNQIYIKMFSNNNAILIGKNGQTLNALQNICRQVISKETMLLPYIILDVENYKEKIDKNIAQIAKSVAKEVKKTGIDATLENMNSYQRRIVHNALSNIEGITTESEGTEPNRHVIIKKK